MGPTLCAMAASLLIGQAQDTKITTTETTSTSGWTQVPGSTQTRTWTQTGTWTPTGGWTYKTTETTGKVPEQPDQRSAMSRISDRLSSLFGNQKAAAAPIPGPPTSAKKVESQARGPIIRTQGEVAKVNTSKVTTSEPPLLEVASVPLQIQAPEPANVNPASFLPGRVEIIAQTMNNGPIHADMVNKIGHQDDYSWLTGQVEVVNGTYIVHYATPSTNDRFGGRMILNGDMDLSPLRNGDLITAHGTVHQGRTISLYRVEAVELIERAPN